MIRIRVDDFPQTKGEPQHTLGAFRDFHRCLGECTGGRRYLLGVIPGRCTVDDLLFIRNETDCAVGMHGTDHDEARLDRNGGNQFEHWMTERDVLSQLSNGRMALEMAVGRPVSVYMPPRNVLDWRTRAAIEPAGFSFFTAGPETNPLIRASGAAVTSLPPLEYGRTDELLARGAVEHLRTVEWDVVLALHWTWETNIGLNHMRRFFEVLGQDLLADFDG